MFKAIIFDLDSCLAAADEVGQGLYEPAFEAIRRANDGSVSEESMCKAFTACWRHPFDWVASQYQFSHSMFHAGWEVFRSLEVVQPMRGYGDLPVLQDLPASLFLVTAGFRRLQGSKIRALAIAPLFSGIYIDAIDEPGRKGKLRFFEEILADRGWKPAEVLVVGDNPESEIEAGNRLGMRTVQILRPGVLAGDNSTWSITTLGELNALLTLSDKEPPPDV